VKKPHLFKPREKFLVLEITPAGANGLFLSVDDERNLIFEKFAKGIDLKKFLKSPVRSVTQSSWEGEYFFKSHRKVIVAADPALATTIPVPLTLSREQGSEKTEIVLAELENMIAQAMQRIFNQCRAEAAKRLGIHEIDTVLVGAKARSFAVDGHRVVNPVGFTGKKISLLLEMTLTGRALFEDLKQFFSSPDDFFFAESPQARLASLARARKLPLNLVVDDGPRGSGLYVLQQTKDGHPVLYREKLPWSFDALFLRIAAELGVSDAAAKELYRSYLAGDMSPAAARAFKKIIDPATAALLKEAEKAKLQGFVYVDAGHDLPFALPHRHGGMTFDRFPAGEILRQLGFADDAHGHMPRRAVYRNLLPFIEAYFDRSNSEINQKLRRRIHWLVD
jgi:hypothetical protein